MHKLLFPSLSHQPHFRQALRLRTLRLSDVTRGVLWNIHAPLEFMCQDVSKAFQQIKKKRKKNCFLRNLLTIEPEFSERQMKGRFAGVIAGTCHVSSLFFAWWMHHLLWTVPWHATKFKSMITSLTFLQSVRSADRRRSVETRWRRRQQHASSCDALQITFECLFSCHVLLELSFVFDLGFLKLWHRRVLNGTKGTRVNGRPVGNKLCVHVWAAWQVQMSTLTFLSGCGRWVRYWIYN